MNFGNISLDIRCELAIAHLCNSIPIDEERKKPLLMHCIRVGMYLYQRDYSQDIVLAGFLHDTLEWTTSSKEMLSEKFSERVCDIVKANTKDRSIENPIERRREYIDRCIQLGEDALIVKVADLLDSYQFYQSVGNAQEIERCTDMATAILEKLPSSFNDSIFQALRLIK